MTNQPGVAPVSPEEESAADENDPGEVPTSFATKGVGWSGRDADDDDDEEEDPST